MWLLVEYPKSFKGNMESKKNTQQQKYTKMKDSKLRKQRRNTQQTQHVELTSLRLQAVARGWKARQDVHPSGPKVGPGGSPKICLGCERPIETKDSGF